MIWMAQSGVPVEILVRLEDQEGLGWFELKREISGLEEDVGRTDLNNADGDAAYQIPAQPDQPGTQPMYLNLRIKCAQGEGVPVMLDVRQNGKTLECRDNYMRPINQGDGGFAPVALGKISAAQAKPYRFDLWF